MSTVVTRGAVTVAGTQDRLELHDSFYLPPFSQTGCHLISKTDFRYYISTKKMHVDSYCVYYTYKWQPGSILTSGRPSFIMHSPSITTEWTITGRLHAMRERVTDYDLLSDIVHD